MLNFAHKLLSCIIALDSSRLKCMQGFGTHENSVCKPTVKGHTPAKLFLNMHNMGDCFSNETWNVIGRQNWRLTNPTYMMIMVSIDLLFQLLIYQSLYYDLEELYSGLQISPTNYFQNGINMSIWSTNYHWKKLREKVCSYDVMKML